MMRLRELPRDVVILMITRLVRLFAYGMLSVVLVLYLTTLGLDDTQVGTLLTVTVLGDLVSSLLITTTADRLGRRRMLMLGGGLVVFAGAVFAATTVVPILTLAAIIGTISPSGYEVGPFLAIEQAILPQLIPAERRTTLFAWAALVGSWATAVGAFAGGIIAHILQQRGLSPHASYQVIVIIYAALGGVLGLCAARLSPAVEVTTLPQAKARKPWRFRSLPQSGTIIVRLALLFSLDAFAGGLIIQSLLAAWFERRFGLTPAALGTLLLATNLLAGVSALAAARIARRVGLLNTMVWTHLPSNVLLILVPFMPTLPLAVGVLLVRFSISQMDVPTRQSYTMAVVAPEERAAAAGITQLARTMGGAMGPLLTGSLFAAGLLNLPLFLAGGLKIGYDLLLYRLFRSHIPPEEQQRLDDSFASRSLQ